jgi:hypothetical protein
MNTKEILEKNPLSAEVVRKWFTNKMFESIQKDDTVPEDFKNFVLNEGLSNENLIIFIETNPRSLFDVFDENEIYLNIFRVKNIFMWALYDSEEQILDGRVFNTRKETEESAVEAAFDILEEKLK